MSLGMMEATWSWGRVIPKILEGVRPADLPMDAPPGSNWSQFGAAQAFGLTQPPNLLSRADRVV